MPARSTGTEACGYANHHIRPIENIAATLNSTAVKLRPDSGPCGLIRISELLVWISG